MVGVAASWSIPAARCVQVRAPWVSAQSGAPARVQLAPVVVVVVAAAVAAVAAAVAGVRDMALVPGSLGRLGNAFSDKLLASGTEHLDRVSVGDTRSEDRELSSAHTEAVLPLLEREAVLPLLEREREQVWVALRDAILQEADPAQEDLVVLEDLLQGRVAKEFLPEEP